MRWTLVVSMDRKVFVAIVDSEVIGRQVVPNVARVVARVMMARDRARKASQAKAKMMMAKEKAKVASGKHAKHLMGAAITVVKWGHMEKDCFIKSKSKGGKGKSAGSLDESEKMDQRTLQLADSVCAQIETLVMTGSGTIVAK